MTATLLLLAAAVPVLGLAEPESPAGGPREAIRRGDRLVEDGKYREAIEVYLRVLPGSEADVLWRISQAYADQGETAPRAEQQTCYERAVEYGRRAVKEAAGRGSSHAALAAALGRKALLAGGRERSLSQISTPSTEAEREGGWRGAPTRRSYGVDRRGGATKQGALAAGRMPERGIGIGSKVKLSKEVKEEAEKAMALDPGHFSPYLILGIWNREVAGLNFFLRAGARILYGGLPGAFYQRSRECLERAVALKPDSPRLHYELGLTLRELGQPDEARREFQKAVDLPRTCALDDKVKSDARAALKN